MRPDPRRILCIDDNAALRDNLREILGDAGYSVQTAGSAAEGLARGREGFDVALVDVRLPDGDGTELAMRLRQEHPDAQLVMLTGFAAIDSAIAATRAGAWAYLVKPCAPATLLLTVEQAVRQVEHVEEKRELARRAQVAEKLAAVGTLMAGLSHEIKNPLNAVGLQLAVLDRRMRKLSPEDQERLREPVLLVQDEVARLNRIMEDFLAFARPQELRLARVDLDALLGRVADVLLAQAEAAGSTLERAWTAVPAVVGDVDRLQQAIFNLVLNAIQAAGKNGVVRIEATRSDPFVRIAIEDTGPGVPEDQRSRIFEPFFTTKEGGSGLGLPFVYSVVEQHGGSIHIETGRRGGARFVVLLPGEAVRPGLVLARTSGT